MFYIHAKNRIQFLKAIQTAFTIKAADKSAEVELVTDFKFTHKVFTETVQKATFDIEAIAGTTYWKIGKKPKIYNGDGLKPSGQPLQQMKKDYFGIGFSVPQAEFIRFHNALTKQAIPDGEYFYPIEALKRMEQDV